eukprot:IDg8543t1
MRLVWFLLAVLLCWASTALASTNKARASRDVQVIRMAASFLFRFSRVTPSTAPLPPVQERKTHRAVYVPRVLIISVVGTLVATASLGAAGCFVLRRRQEVIADNQAGTTSQVATLGDGSV